MFLIADIGGTKTELALLDPAAGPRHFVRTHRFDSGRYRSLEEIVQRFLGDQTAHVSGMAAGIAGPVRNNRVQVTNLPWVVNADSLSEALGGTPILLLNDLEAIAYGVPSLGGKDMAVLKEGVAEPQGPIAIIAPGTGLGEAFLIWDGARYRPIPSEGGHTDFAPADEVELELLRYLLPRLVHVSYERVCSGIGIPNLYAFLRDTGREVEPEWLREELATATDATRVIMVAALEEQAPICKATLELFFSILGNEAGNLFLKILASGGIYLAGGIPPRVAPQLQRSRFLEAFSSKGRFSDLLQKVPVFIIMQPQTALIGAANACLLRFAS
jgi:glucokinase